jgi:hypothetical protein
MAGNQLEERLVRNEKSSTNATPKRVNGKMADKINFF